MTDELKDEIKRLKRELALVREREACPSCTVYENTVNRLQSQLQAVSPYVVRNRHGESVLMDRLAETLMMLFEVKEENAKLRRNVRRARDSSRKYYELWKAGNE